jgi:hypothetical protein
LHESAHPLEAVICQQASRLLDVELAQLLAPQEAHLAPHTRSSRPPLPTRCHLHEKKNKTKNKNKINFNSKKH